MLKRWHYVGVYGPDVMLCVGDARVGPLPQRWWAVAEPGLPLAERTTFGKGGVEVSPTRVTVDADGVRIDLELERAPDADVLEVASPAGRAWIWTRKQGAVRARGRVEVAGRAHDVEADAFVDESAGYHDRVTIWKWCAGVGRSRAGERVAWNLVEDIHDAPKDSERAVWVDGRAVEVERVSFADDLSAIDFAEGARIGFDEWSARESSTNLLVFRNRYRQPFGTFSGTLPGGVELAEGYGVMEEHDVRW